VGDLSAHYEALSVEASKQTTSEEIVVCIVDRLKLKDSSACYELAEVVGDGCGQECKERRLGAQESPVQLMMLWPKISDHQEEHYRYLGCPSGYDAGPTNQTSSVRFPSPLNFS